MINRKIIKTIIIFSILGFILLSFEIGMSLLSNTKSSFIKRGHSSVLYDIQIDIETETDRENEYEIECYRISPRGNPDKLNNIVKIGNKLSWIDHNNYYSGIKIVNNSKHISIKNINIVINNKRYAIRNNFNDQKTIYIKENIISNQQSIFPLMNKILNYRGDSIFVLLSFFRISVLLTAVIIFIRIKNNQFSLQKFFLIGIVGYLSIIYGFEILSKTSKYIILKDFLFLFEPAFLFLLISSMILILIKIESVNEVLKISKQSVSLFILVIFFLALILRIGNYNYFPGGDNFSLISARALNDTGSYHYPRNANYTYIISFLFRIFGVNLLTARIPFILISVLTIYPLLKISSLFGKSISIISIFLYAISPWSIEKSTQIRDYSENLFWGAVLYSISYYIYMKSRKYKKIKLIGWFFLSSLVVYFYSKTFIQQSILGILHVNLFLISYMIFFDFFFLNKGKFKYYSVAILTMFAVIFFSIIYKVEPFIKGINIVPEFLLMFIDPKINSPVQWFSSRYLSLWIPVSIIILPLLDKNKRIFLPRIISYATFFSIIIVFLFKAHTFGSRFMYHLLPFYILIIADGIDSFLKIILNASNKKLLTATLAILFLTILLSPFNTAHAFKHDLPDLNDNRKITKIGNLNIFYNIEKYMRNKGVDNNSIILVEIQRPDIISWLFSDRVDRYFSVTSYGGVSYDIGNNIYFKSKILGVDETDLALKRSNSGFFLTYNKNYPFSDITVSDKIFKYIGNVDNYKLYKW